MIEPHDACWHPLANTLHVGFTTQTTDVCCHCGHRRTIESAPGGLPDGHGAYYPAYLTPRSNRVIATTVPEGLHQ